VPIKQVSRRTLEAMEISVEMVLAGRELTEPRLSPDGRWVGFVARWGIASAIVSIPVAGGPERIVTAGPPPAPGRGLGGGCFDWLPDGSALVYAARDGDLWLQPFPGGGARRLSDVGDDRRLVAPAVAPDGATVAAVLDQAEVWSFGLDAAVPSAPGRSGDGTHRMDDGSADFVFDPSPMPRGVDPGWIWQAWNVPHMPWDASRAQFVTRRGGAIERGEFEPRASIQQLRHLPDGRGLSVRDDTGWLNVWAGDEPLVAEPYEHAGPTWGMGQRSFAASPDGGQVAFARNEAGFGRLCVVEVATGDVREIARGVHGQLSWRGNSVTALRSGARTPTQIVRYDTGSWERTELATGPVAGWEEADLPEPEPIEIGHGGVTLHARRYAAGRGRTLCWIHGGPTDQWQVEFMPRIAYWWSRGWDVLVPDPRGSTGHGRAYQQALRGEWGRLDVDDAAAILRASHVSGASSPDRTVMMGSSSGGLTALGVVGRHPGSAAGAVVLYPVTELASLADESHRFEAHSTLGLVGPADDVERYRERSPISYADRIDVPVLVMHGDDDPVVPLSSTLSFVERMRVAGGDVELVVMEGEGHGFRDPANKRADYEHTARFLSRVVSDAG
jgi:dipeptidyl aminopeptidase/acylaminoacyl peptidase